MLPKLFSKKFLGIDIGALSLKMVELEEAGDSFSLSNYGQFDVNSAENSDVPGLNIKTMAELSTQEIAEIIKDILLEAKIKTRHCAFSIPDFSTFFTTFSLPAMTQKELSDAVLFEARQHIPLPISNVAVDWQLIGGEFGKSDKMEIAITAIPNEIIARYKDIAAKAKLQLVLIEAEAFGLLQALVPMEESKAICLIDIGVQSTVCSLVEKRILRYSHSFDRGADYLFKEFARQLPIGQEIIDLIEKKYGFSVFSLIDSDIKKSMKDIFSNSFLPILREIEMALDEYRKFSGIEVAKIILSGGVGALPETREQFKSYLKIETEIADPFAKINYPAEAKDEIKKIGSAYAVAVGMAQRGFELTKKS